MSEARSSSAAGVRRRIQILLGTPRARHELPEAVCEIGARLHRRHIPTREGDDKGADRRPERGSGSLPRVPWRYVSLLVPLLKHLTDSFPRNIELLRPVSCYSKELVGARNQRLERLADLQDG